MEEVKELTEQFKPELVIIESGGDNLAANFSRELADFIIYVVDVAGKPSGTWADPEGGGEPDPPEKSQK